LDLLAKKLVPGLKIYCGVIGWPLHISFTSWIDSLGRRHFRAERGLFGLNARCGVILWQWGSFRRWFRNHGQYRASLLLQLVDRTRHLRDRSANQELPLRFSLTLSRRQSQVNECLIGKADGTFLASLLSQFHFVLRVQSLTQLLLYGGWLSLISNLGFLLHHGDLILQEIIRQTYHRAFLGPSHANVNFRVGRHFRRRGVDWRSSDWRGLVREDSTQCDTSTSL
jgi:hypothetical protein